MIADAHVHFFSAGFFRALGREAGHTEAQADGLPRQLGWDEPGADEQLADRWIAELDRHHVDHALVMASAPGDEQATAAAALRHPARLSGAFMFDPSAADAPARLERAFTHPGLRAVCLFPAMHHVAIDDPRVEAVFQAAERHRRAVFVHCGMLSIGVRHKLGLPSRFDLRMGDPLAVAAVAVRFPSVPTIIPHFGAGFFRNALMAARAAANIVLDTSSSNSWMSLERLTLREVFGRALDVLGPSKLVFGSDSSFFPRGWQAAIYEEQLAALTDLGVGLHAQALIFGGTLERLLGLPGTRSGAARV